MSTLRRRPELRLELDSLGTVDPFALDLFEQPPGSGEFALRVAGPKTAWIPLDLAGLHVVGAGQALLGLSARWLGAAGRDVGGEEAGMGPGVPGLTEVRLIIKRKHARLLAALMRRHLKRLPQPPPWMTELFRSFTQIDEFLRWELEPPEDAR